MAFIVKEAKDVPPAKNALGRQRRIVKPKTGASAVGVFEGMAYYVGQKDRTAPPVFVGRREALDDLLDAVRLTGRAGTPAEGMTRLVHGPPGAGKSAVMREFIRQHHGKMMRGPKAGDGSSGQEFRVVCVNLDPAALSAPPLLLARQIHNEINSNKAGRHLLRAAEAKVIRAVNALSSASGMPSAHESLAKVDGLENDSSLQDCLNAYANEHWGDDLVIALCLDEVQSCPATENARTAVRVLHECKHNARIVALCFGLPGADDHLTSNERLGLSRLASRGKRGICELGPGEGRQVIERTLKHLGVDWSRSEWRGHLEKGGFDEKSWESFSTALVDLVADGAHDFPQHLTIGVAAVCQAFLDRKSTGLKAGAARNVLNEVRGLHNAGKRAYYEERMGQFRACQYALGAVCLLSANSADGWVDMDDALSAISAEMQGPVPAVVATPRQLVLNAVEHGVLTKRAGQVGHPGIPSMRDHMIAVLQDGVDRGVKAAVRAAEAVGLDATPSSTNGLTPLLQ